MPGLTLLLEVAVWAYRLRGGESSYVLLESNVALAGVIGLDMNGFTNLTSPRDRGESDGRRNSASR